MSSSRSERARELRSVGLSVREIAQALEVPRATVGDWVRGVDRGAHGHLAECWCGEMFFTKSPLAKFCSRAHTMAAAGKAYRARKRARA